MHLATVTTIQPCLAALLLAPSSHLPATSHWGIHALTHSDTNTHTHVCTLTRIFTHAGKWDTSRWEYLKHWRLERESIRCPTKSNVTEKSRHVFGADCFAAPAAGINYANCIWRYFQMSDRFPNWQLACVGFSSARLVRLPGDKRNG